MRIRTPLGYVTLALGLVTLGAYIWLLTKAMDTQSYNTWGGLMVVPIVVLVDLMLLAAVRRGRDRWVTGVMLLGLCAKFVGIFVRYFVAYVVYGGAADAERYNLYAALHYFDWRKGIVVWEVSDKTGTQYTELITTAIYFVTGPSTIGAFFIFGSLAYWGVYLLYRAFQEGVPDGDNRRYALLVFLLPSLLYWPSSIGKEAWLMLFLGVSAFGVARFFNRRFVWGLGLIGGGLAGIALIRPHIAVLLAVALMVAQLMRPTQDPLTGTIGKILGFTLIAGAVAILATQSAAFLGLEDVNLDAIIDEVEGQAETTGQGGSAFTPVPLDSPWGFLAVAGTVLFRPFPWEAVGVPMLVQSIEAMLIILLILVSWRRLRGLPGAMRRHPYVVFSVVFTIAFIIAFSGFANFGILARQRVQMLPFLLVLLALPLPVRRRTRQPSFENARPVVLASHV